MEKRRKSGERGASVDLESHGTSESGNSRKGTDRREIALAFLAEGHVLLEDMPGVERRPWRWLSRGRCGWIISGYSSRLMCCLRSDGISVYRREQEKFVYRKGSVFCNLLLADEINRTSPKTQSALLEVMEERKVTVEGITRSVPSPFW